MSHIPVTCPLCAWSTIVSTRLLIRFSTKQYSLKSRLTISDSLSRWRQRGQGGGAWSLIWGWSFRVTVASLGRMLILGRAVRVRWIALAIRSVRWVTWRRWLFLYPRVWRMGLDICSIILLRWLVWSGVCIRTHINFPALQTMIIAKADRNRFTFLPNRWWRVLGSSREYPHLLASYPWTPFDP